MSLVGRSLKRSSQPKNGSSLLPDDQPISADQRSDAVESASGKHGVLLKDLLGVEPSGFKPDLDWAAPDPGSTQATASDDTDAFDNTAELEVGRWPAASPSANSQEPTYESSQAGDATSARPEDGADGAGSVTLPASRWPAWARERSRLLVLLGLATIGLVVTGGIIVSSRPGASATAAGSGLQPTAEQTLAVRPALSAVGSAPPDVDAPKADTEGQPTLEPPAGLAAPAGKSKVGVRTVVATADPGSAVKTHRTRMRADPRSRRSAPRSSARLALGERSHNGAAVSRATPATGALALYNEGARLQKAGATDKAISAYIRALGEDSSLIEAHNNLAVLRMHSGDASGAERSLRAAVELNSRYGPAYANLGRLYIQQRRTDEAEIMLLRAASLMPSNASVRNNLALLYQLLGRDEDEANAWRSALALGSEDAAVHYNLAVHYQRLAEPALARLHYQKALAPESRLSPAYRDSARRALESLK